MEDKFVELASLIFNFSKVDRKTLYPDGLTPESDTDHTVMLGIAGAALAKKLYPDLDIGLVSQFALVHDLVEAYAGDTDTLVGVEEDTMRIKADKEAEALKRIEQNFGTTFPWIHETIESYEKLDTKEARFVKTLDKILPKITVILNNAASLNKREVTQREVRTVFDKQREKLRTIAYDMPELMELWEYFMSKEIGLIERP